MSGQLHRKEIDNNQYLHPSSCHPRLTSNLIPFSFGFRIVLICLKKEDRIQRALRIHRTPIGKRLYNWLVEFCYCKGKGNKPNLAKIPVVSISYNPTLQTISSMQAKYWIVTESYLKEVFSGPPTTAYRKNNILEASLSRQNKENRKEKLWVWPNATKKNANCAYNEEEKSHEINNSDWIINE